MFSSYFGFLNGLKIRFYLDFVISYGRLERTTDFIFLLVIGRILRVLVNSDWLISNCRRSSICLYLCDFVSLFMGEDGDINFWSLELQTIT